ncbi:MAG TPA: DUF1345 domain-containing protein [Rhizomicrobium sp.]|nr:DUF1345 domain-containing protein [Rhizomicrobium sp.]
MNIRSHLYHHGRFYIAALIGVAVFAFGGALQPQMRLLAAGDTFFLLYLITSVFLIGRFSADDLRERAAKEDEGIALVLLIVLGVIAMSTLAIVTVLREKTAHAPLPLTLALAGAPLAWFTLHVIATFHYANLYYARKENGPQSVRGLDFKNTKEPGIWEFLYYSFTIGMTAQTSDTDVTDTKMRRATLGHSVVSFFYNTAIIAMAVNAVVAIAS